MSREGEWLAVLIGQREVRSWRALDGRYVTVVGAIQRGLGRSEDPRGTEVGADNKGATGQRDRGITNGSPRHGRELDVEWSRRSQAWAQCYSEQCERQHGVRVCRHSPEETCVLNNDPNNDRTHRK